MKIKRSQLKVGMVVMLRADKREGWRAERAEVMGLEGNRTIMVCVEPHDDEDDGLREVSVHQITSIVSKGYSHLL